jgi:hypothetical protein
MSASAADSAPAVVHLDAADRYPSSCGGYGIEELPGADRIVGSFVGV